MLVLPVVSRELLIQARRKGTYRIRVAASGIASCLMIWLLLLGAAPVPTVSQGRMLFSILSGLAFAYCLVVGALVTADGLSAEKREGTLGLLFLTNLKGYDVVLGKLVSSSLHCAYGLLAVVPMLAMALLFGGVTAAEVARMILVLGNTLFFSLAAGVFASTLSRNERRAVFSALLVVLIVTAGPYELGYYLADNFTRGTAMEIVSAVLPPSPLFAFLQAEAAAGTWRAASFYGSVVVTQAIAWVLLGLSCYLAPRVCRDRPQSPWRQRWSERWQRWRLGNAEQRAAFRRRLLDRNPCFWLSSRERHQAAMVWVLVGAMTAVGLWVCTRYQAVFYETSLLLLGVLEVLLKVWFAGETCQRWVEDRRSGALEVLLCAPVRTQDLVRGQGLALRRQFGWPVVVTLGLMLVSWIVIRVGLGLRTYTEFGRKWLLLSPPALVADLVALRWVGAWLGLRARGVNRAVAGTLFRVLTLRWLLFLVWLAVASAWAWVGLGQSPLPQEAWIWLVMTLILDGALAWSARRKFLRHFRTVVANPLDYGRGARLWVPSDTSSAAATPVSPREAGGDFRRVWLNRRLAFALGALGVVVGFPWGYRLWSRGEVDRRIRAVQQAGYPTSQAELNRGRPPLVGVNAATVLEQAYAASVPDYRMPRAVLEQLRREQSYVEPPHPLGKPVLQAMESFLASNEVALAIVHRAPSLRVGRYAADWNVPFGHYRNQSQGIAHVSLLLQDEVVIQTERGDTAGAFDSLHRAFDLGRSLSQEPGWMFQSMRMASLQRALGATEWWLKNRRPASAPGLDALPGQDPARGVLAGQVDAPAFSAELAALQRDVLAVENETDLTRAMVSLRCLAIESYRSQPLVANYAPRGPSPMADYLQSQVRGRLYELTGARDRDFARFLDTLAEFVRLATTPLPKRFVEARALASAPDQPTGGSTPTGDWLYSPQMLFNGWVGPNADFVARCRVVRTALALERFRASHDGRLPGRLDPLVPGLLAEPVIDPFTGGPLHYRRLARGYQVYSVGRNGRDDGGFAGNGRRAQRRSGSGHRTSDDVGIEVEW
ncbi:MAG: ABC transporter permease [Verrucomicrobia bacterium]|nr:ABC transporter permease [Verrucomicrobiota bacterium]